MKNPSDNTTPANTFTLDVHNRRKGPDRRKFDDPNYRGPERRRFGSRRLSDEIETFFGSLGRILCKYRFAAIAEVLLVVLGLTAMIPRITVDTSSEALLHQDDPILLEYNRFRDRFGRSEMVIVAVEPENVFNHGFITWLEALHTALADFVVAPALMIVITRQRSEVRSQRPKDGSRTHVGASRPNTIPGQALCVRPEDGKQTRNPKLRILFRVFILS